MKRNLRDLADQSFDLLIIGGGIFGAGIARDATLRGLSVAMIEQADFASGTSSRSSKLIHGGFRYLAQRKFGLVAEACRERATLQRIAPHLVRPLSFLLPAHEGSTHSLATMRIGMTLYDWLARGRNIAPHQTLSAEQALALEPALARAGLRGAIRFHDCQTDDARFCLDTIIDAAERGAVCANYCALVGFDTRDGRIVAARGADRIGGETFEIRARAFVNAAGPWLANVAGLAPLANNTVALNPTKGIHLLLPRLTREHALVFQSRRDGRFLFVLQWGDGTLVGTTDTDYRGEPDQAAATQDDIAYLLDELRHVLPDCIANDPQIVTTFAGVRALLGGDTATPSARSREHRLVRHGANLLSIAGGKFTTHRAIAEQAVGETLEMLEARPRRCRTADTPLPNRRPAPSGRQIADMPVVFASDIAHACEQEMALTVSDVMRRRTTLALSRRGGPDIATIVAQQMAPLLGWNDRQMHEHWQHYHDEWTRAKP